jgi:hypothetical protein
VSKRVTKRKEKTKEKEKNSNPGVMRPDMVCGTRDLFVQREFRIQH